MSDATARRTNDASAYGEVVWSWHPLLMSSPRRRVGPTGPGQALSAGDGGKRNSSPGSAKETVPTIACGNAGCFRCTCGDLLVCFHHSHARLPVHRHPAFPTPSTGGSFGHASGTSFRGNAEACVRHTSVIARSEATKQSIPQPAAPWIASLALAMTVRRFPDCAALYPGYSAAAKIGAPGR